MQTIGSEHGNCGLKSPHPDMGKVKIEEDHTQGEKSVYGAMDKLGQSINFLGKNLDDLHSRLKPVLYTKRSEDMEEEVVLAPSCYVPLAQDISTLQARIDSFNNLLDDIFERLGF